MFCAPGFLAGCGKTPFRSAFGKGTSSLVPSSPRQLNGASSACGVLFPGLLIRNVHSLETRFLESWSWREIPSRPQLENTPAEVARPGCRYSKSACHAGAGAHGQR